ncbi:hypothetical protein ACQ4M3_10595 [Leptolyngbya sp. AN03gr2]|uniref:hypothetical protein n=1 Tax=unclassified Leptolyngbya TaxID=2650499 RepID=UPI003D3227ED
MYAAENEILKLVQAFENCTLARSHWTHSAHLTVALWYLIDQPLTAPDQIRFGIQRYNQAHVVESTPTTGYHETITRFWIHLIQNYLDSVNVHDSLLSLTNQLMNDYSNPIVLFEYYSRDLIFSPEARSRWIEPNLKSLNYARL